MNTRPTNRVQRVAGPVALGVCAVAAALLALAGGGGASAPARLDPGAFVRWGLPIANLMVFLGAAGMIGALVLVCLVLSPERPEYERALGVAAGSAAVMTVMSAITAVMTYSDVSGTAPALDQGFSDGIIAFLTQDPVGRAWLAVAAIAAITTVLCLAVRSPTSLVLVTVLALLSLLPVVLSVPAAGDAAHDRAATALGLQLVFAAVWVGGLLTVVLLGRSLDGERLVPVVERYSALAIVSFVVVAFAGIVDAVPEVGTPRNLFTAYGVLVLVEAAVLVVLGILAAVRLRSPAGRPGGGGGRGPFWWRVVAELGLMGVAAGVAAALAHTADPVSSASPARPTPAEVLTGQPLPPPASLGRYLSGVSLDPLWVVGCAFALAFFFAGVARLRRRGEPWPIGRTIAWVVGVVLLLWVTGGGIDLYGQYLFSASALVRMLLVAVVPLLLVAGAPFALALRAVRGRTDGSRGPREWILLVARSRTAAFLAHPITAAVLFAGSLWVFFRSSLSGWATTDHLGHEWMVAQLLVVGCLFVRSIVGGGGVSSRSSSPLRLVVPVVVMVFQALLGLSIATSTGLLLADWYGAMGRTWGLPPLADQQLAGGIVGGVGVICTLALAVVVVVRRRRDRAVEASRGERRAAAGEAASGHVDAASEAVTREAEARATARPVGSGHPR